MSYEALEIDGRRIGAGHPAFLIAEVAQTHDGSLGLAHAFIDSAANAGADAIKFQTHIAEAESTRDEQFRVTFSQQDKTRYDYWKRMEFTPEQWSGLADHARERGITFLSSAFSVAAVDMLRKVGAPAWKVGSGEFRSQDLLEAMATDQIPILFSTGMSTWDEIDSAVRRIRELGAPIALFQCTSLYPTPLEQVGLNIIDAFKSRFACPAGLSDHSGDIHPALAAMARGADLVEVHITLHRNMFGPDVPASLTPEEIRTLADAREAFAVMDANPVDKDRAAESLSEMRELFTKSLAPSRPLSAGTSLTPDMLVSKKPGTGIPAEELERIVGRKLKRDVTPNRLLRSEDFE